MNKKIIALFAAGLILAACDFRRDSSIPQEAWSGENNPFLLGGNFNQYFDELPRTARLHTLPWSDSYWQSNKGGISYRWRTKSKNYFDYRLPTKGQIFNMSMSQLADLSPAEKYDIFMGRYDFPTVKLERERTSRQDKKWEGICHGWAPAALHFTEPHPVLIDSVDGVAVPFGSSDVKALLSYYQGELSDAPTRFLGMRCDLKIKKHRDLREFVKRHPECKGVNAGAFHVAIANVLGNQHKGLVIDVSHGMEIWNQPVYGFKTRVIKEQPPSAGAAAGTAREVRVETEIFYTDETDAKWRALNGSAQRRDDSMVYSYRLELDEVGKIIGGAWQKFDRPDFMWLQERPSFQGYWGFIRDIYERSLGGPFLPEPRE